MLAAPPWYQAQSRYDLIFCKIAPAFPNPGQALQELGMEPADARWMGMHVYMPGNPMFDPKFSERFIAHTSYGRVLQFYLRHPSIPLSFLHADLRNEAWHRRVFSNFRKQDGHPPGAQTDRLGSWSALRTWLFRMWPEHIVLWYAAVLFVPPILARRDPSLGSRRCRSTRRHLRAALLPRHRPHDPPDSPARR